MRKLGFANRELCFGNLNPHLYSATIALLTAILTTRCVAITQTKSAMKFDFEQDSYKSLSKIIAERTSSIVAWVGAGLSAQAGLPSWHALITNLAKVARRKAASLSDHGHKKSLLDTLEFKIKERQYWVAFQIARDLLGPTTYESEIRGLLEVPASPPESYVALWNAGIQGMISLNLDHFAQQAYSIFAPGAKISPFVGSQARHLAGVLQRSSHFIGNPHGLIDNAESWVFTQDKLQELLNDSGYVSFITASLISRTMLFVGVTVDDVAIEHHLKILKNAGISGISHYWITNRIDSATDEWAENHGLRIIRYESKDLDHSPLLECLRGLAIKSASLDQVIVAPVVSELAKPAASIMAAEELIYQPLEDVRLMLNGHVLSLLSESDEIGYAKYEEFERNYDEAIDRAWYVGPPPKNRIFGYTLNKQVAQGSFGDVYEATAPDGSIVALKLLRRDVRRMPAMLQTFRRGVRSMKIIKRHKMPGLVDFRDASEIPAFVAMEWINGPNLGEAVKSNFLDSWQLQIKVAKDLADIIHSAHMLPERVLHRDIRPPNVMLRNFWETQEPDVVVMDFDLSWHKDALEKSIVAKPLGFMAPEQLLGGRDTRSALVDSYGFGMTLFFMLTREVPVPNQQLHKEWLNTLHYKIASRPCKEWKSLPQRMMRLVIGTTKTKQTERLDFSQITAELKALSLLINGGFESVSGDYFCEEIAATTECMAGYNWNAEDDRALYISGGLKIEIFANLPQDEIIVKLRWQQTGEENWKIWPKTSSQVAERAGSILDKHGWRKPRYEASYGQVTISASYDIDRLNFNARRLGDGINGIVASMTPKN